jgi:hypothetical protein
MLRLISKRSGSANFDSSNRIQMEKAFVPEMGKYSFSSQLRQSVAI